MSGHRPGEPPASDNPLDGPRALSAVPARALFGILTTTAIAAVSLFAATPALAAGAAYGPYDTTITLVKTVDNGNSGSTAKPGDWTLSAVGLNDSVSGKSGSPAVTDAVINSGLYSLSESGPAGYEAGDWVCQGAQVQDDGTSVIVETGFHAVCTIHNTARDATWTVSKTSDPASGSVVEPGDTITYTVKVTHTGGVYPDSLTVTDDLSQVTPHTTPSGSITASTGTASANDSQLSWTITDWPSDTATLTYSVVVDEDAVGASIRNVLTVPPGGSCTGTCTTDHSVPSLTIDKTHGTLPSEPLDSDAGQRIPYRIVVSNLGAASANSITVHDALPEGLSYDPSTVVVPAGWTFVIAGSSLTVTASGALGSGLHAEITFDAVVGELPRDGIGSVIGDVVNTACVTAYQVPEACDTDIIKVKSIAMDASAVCLKNVPYVNYEIRPNHIPSDPPPVVAMIWWSAAAYAARHPGIDAADKPGLLADGASQVDYLTVPEDWVSGGPISGQQLWPGATVDGDGNGTDWPGWTELPDGTWILDPSAPFYDLRLTSVVEFRINPTVSETVSYPPATDECGPTNPNVDLAVAKSHGPIDGDAVDSGEGDIVSYELTITNHGTSDAHGVNFVDTLPTGLVVDPTSIVGPAGWTFTLPPGQLLGSTEDPLPPGASVTITYNATVGVLPRVSIGALLGNLENRACVDSTEPDMKLDDNCNTDVVKTKSIALTANAVCQNDTPFVSYSILPTNIVSDPPPTVAMIWWTPAAYAARNPDIDAADEAGILADGAIEVDYVDVPGDWTAGLPLTGTLLWPGAAVDANGNPTDWPGWSQHPDGTWFLDSSDPFYVLRTTSIVEFRINPTVAKALSYPPATALCAALPTLAIPPGEPGSPGFLAMTGAAPTLAVQAGALLIVAGAVLARRRRRRRA